MSTSVHAITGDVLIAAADANAPRKCAEMLAGLGSSIRNAADGVQTIHYLLDRQPSLLLIEIRLPVIDGIQLARMLRAWEPEERRMRIIGVHDSRADADVGDRFAAAGGDGLLPSWDAVADLQDHIAAPPRQWPRRERQGSSASRLTGPFRPTVSMPEALARLGGDEELLADLVQFFFEDGFPLLATMHAALERRDWDPMRRAAHSLKGLVSNFSAAAAVGVLQQIETFDGEAETTARALAQNVDVQIVQVTAQLARYVACHPRTSSDD